MLKVSFPQFLGHPSQCGSSMAGSQGCCAPLTQTSVLMLTYTLPLFILAFSISNTNASLISPSLAWKGARRSEKMLGLKCQVKLASQASSPFTLRPCKFRRQKQASWNLGRTRKGRGSELPYSTVLEVVMVPIQ